MVDKKNPASAQPQLSGEIAQRVRTQIVHGDVGYGQPPKEHQFKKGQRANPKGRPRKAAPDLTLAEQPELRAIRDLMNSKMKVLIDGKVVELFAYEALTKNGFGFAMKGNARYYGMLMDAARQAEEANAREIREHNDFWVAYQQIARRIIDEAIARGEPEPEILPHPNDFITDRDGRLVHIGPFDEIGKAATDKNIMLRDAYVLQGGLDQRMMPPPSDGDPLKGPGTAFEFAKFIDRSLPPRLRMGDFQMFRQMDFYSRHPLRWLLKTVSETWRKVGVPRKRGELSLPLGGGLTSVNLARDLCERILDGTVDENFGLQPVVEMIRENGEFAQQQGWL